RIWRRAYKARIARTDTAIAHDYRGYALAYFGQHRWRGNDIGVVVSVHVDKSRCEMQAFSLDDYISCNFSICINERNQSLMDSNFSAVDCGTRAIDNFCAANQGVVNHKAPGAHQLLKNVCVIRTDKLFFGRSFSHLTAVGHYHVCDCPNE